MGDLQLAMIAEVQQEGKFNRMRENYPQIRKKTPLEELFLCNTHCHLSSNTVGSSWLINFFLYGISIDSY